MERSASPGCRPPRWRSRGSSSQTWAQEGWAVHRSKGQVERERWVGEWQDCISFRCKFYNNKAYSLSNLCKCLSCTLSTHFCFLRQLGLEYWNTPNHSKGVWNQSFTPLSAFKLRYLKVWSADSQALYILNNLSGLFKMHVPGPHLRLLNQNQWI